VEPTRVSSPQVDLKPLWPGWTAGLADIAGSAQPPRSKRRGGERQDARATNASAGTPRAPRGVPGLIANAPTTAGRRRATQVEEGNHALWPFCHGLGWHKSPSRRTLASFSFGLVREEWSPQPRVTPCNSHNEYQCDKEYRYVRGEFNQKSEEASQLAVAWHRAGQPQDWEGKPHPSRTCSAVA